MTPEEVVEEKSATRAELRRRNIVDVSRKLFIENGFHSTGIALIASQSGVAVGQIYRDFSSKEDIIAAITEADRQEIITSSTLSAAIAAQDPDLVYEWINELMSLTGEDAKSRLLMEIMAEVGRNPRIASIFIMLQHEVRQCLATALAVVVPGDDLQPRRIEVAETILALSLGLMHHRLGKTNYQNDPVTLSMLRFIKQEIEGLRTPG